MTIAEASAPSTPQAQFDVLVAGLRKYAPYAPDPVIPGAKKPRTDLGGWDLLARRPGPLSMGATVRPIVEWDAYRFEHEVRDAKDPNILLRTDQEVWVSVQMVVNGQEIDGKKRTGMWLVDFHWPASEVHYVGDPKVEPPAPMPVEPEGTHPEIDQTTYAPKMAPDVVPVSTVVPEQPRLGGKFVKRET